MEVVLPMKRLMHLVAKRQEILRPTFASAEVGIIGIELEPDTTGEAVEHCIHHVVDLDEQAAVNTDMIHHSPMEDLIDLPIGHYIQLFHIMYYSRFFSELPAPVPLYFAGVTLKR